MRLNGTWRGPTGWTADGVRHGSTSGTRLLRELEQRGFLKDLTSAPVAVAGILDKPIGIYCGFDPTASSLHLGNLIQLTALYHFHANGHRVVALVGGATGEIGDPSGRAKERAVLESALVESNARALTSQIRSFFARADSLANRTSGPVTVLDNREWIAQLSLTHFLTEVGRFARLSTMLSRESVKSRLETEQSLSFTEFSYQLLQALDFYTLYKHHGVQAQLGGSDQWGNILAGLELIRRKEGDAQGSKTIFGMTIPLLLTSAGEKFGKSAGNAVWLDPNMTSPFDLYQTSDADLARYFGLFTFLSLPDISRILSDHEQDRTRRLGQRRLAVEVTALVHGKEAAARARLATRILFPGPVEKDEAEATLDEVRDALQGTPYFHAVPRDRALGQPLVRLLTTVGAASSRGQAFRLLQEGGVSVSGESVGTKSLLEASHIDARGLVTLKIGKREVRVIHVSPTEL